MKTVDEIVVEINTSAYQDGELGAGYPSEEYRKPWVAQLRIAVASEILKEIEANNDPKEKSYWTVQWELAPQSVIIGTVFKYQDDFDTRPTQIFQEDEPKLFHDLQDYLTKQVHRKCI